MKKENINKMLKGILITTLVMIPVSFLMYRDMAFTLIYIPITIIQALMVVFVGIMIEKSIRKLGIKNLNKKLMEI